jgi:hypothetical protein
LAKPAKAQGLLGSELVVINLGLDTFRLALVQQKVRCAQVVLQPVPKLDKRLQAALDKLL